MKIKEFISNVLDEMQDLKSNNNKQRYIVQELEFDISLIVKSSITAGSSKVLDLIIPINAKGEYSNDEIQKVKIKLKPKQIISRVNNTRNS